ncbi:MoaD/ThiS family protein [Ruania alba]|uniref:Molybdopterin converting factor, small subunit n=1 Tax=Ruania alba TaxID=648782 RepID=A0A1H5MWQ3_9MICO|nr:MoaD/ThiS family protein [Ruania alba]SEE93157.1 Molybdopterin converting factor, small subunit [Ruania alba]
MTEVRYFAAAAEAAGRHGESLAANSVGELRSLMIERHGEGLERVLTRCSLLVDGVVTDDATSLEENDVVDVLPPFAGG